MVKRGDSSKTTIQKLALNEFFLQALHGRHVGLMIPEKGRMRRWDEMGERADVMLQQRDEVKTSLWAAQKNT